MTYNGWRTRETWLVNVWGNPTTKSDLRMIREDLEEQLCAMPNGILKDMIDLQQIDWEQLESHMEDEEEDEEADVEVDA